ncbi:DUF192 domain-containing protein [Poseidonocella pacifica]|uniref:DUF192 domain-containing protein n=1 Tax=Poseidonocella pacifica TaxID=871651 RepID=UPI000AE77685|nr:DUF192 domain-containing protein [Poseidonocella pacifica]
MFLLFTASVSTAEVAAFCSPDRVDLRMPAGTATYTVEIADTQDSRAQGLMYREEMAPESGMLFVYERPHRASFWMRNTLIPLDMIFVDPRGRVTDVHVGAIPGDETPITGGPRTQFVLEVNEGQAEEQGIVPGAQLRHPAISQDGALWPC